MATNFPTSQGNTSADSGFVPDTMNVANSPTINQTVSQESVGARMTLSLVHTAPAPAQVQTLDVFTKEPDRSSREDNTVTADPEVIPEVQPAPPPGQSLSAQDHEPGIVSPETQTANKPTQEGLRTVEEKMLDILTKMYEKMEGQQYEGHGHHTVGGMHNAPFKQTYFGMPKQRFNPGQPLNSGNEDYEEIFSEDAYGEEVGPNARVFRVYNEEAATYDMDMIRRASDSSDALLVFAGLFSAVLTTFVAQTSQTLDTDNEVITNSLLLEIVHLLRAKESNTSFGAVNQTIMETTASGDDLFVNGLWFTSLTFSLATAMFAVLTKQWLNHYVTSISGTIRDRSLVRQFRFAGMEKWHVLAIIGALPTLLHLALGIFLVGLVLFLLCRCYALGCVVLVMTIIIYSLYIITNLLPVFFIQCPYRTPLSDVLHKMCYQARAMAFHLIILTETCVSVVIPIFFRAGYATMGICIALYVLYLGANFAPTITRPHRPITYLLYYLQCKASPFLVKLRPGYQSLGEREHDRVHKLSRINDLSLDVITWLMNTSSNPSVQSMAIQAVGGLAPSQIHREWILGKCIPTKDFLSKLIKECLVSPPNSRLERFARAYPVLRRTLKVGPFENPDLYEKFPLMGNVKEKAAALSCFMDDQISTAGDILHHLLYSSPGIELAPYTWLNLLWATKVSRSEDLATICARALQDAEGWKLTSWDKTAAQVTISTALPRMPDMIIRVFKAYDESSEPSSGLTPSVVRLRALLALHHFLEHTFSTTSSHAESSVQLLCTIWDIIHSLFKDHEDDITMADYGPLHDATTRCLAQSPLLNGEEWKTSDRLSTYCRNILKSRRLAILRSQDIRKSWRISFSPAFKYVTYLQRRLERESTSEFLERLAGIFLPVDDIACCDTFRSDIRHENLWHWKTALDNDIEGAYTVFININVLARCDHDEVTCYLVAAFVSGLSRQDTSSWDLRRRPDPKWVSDSLEYLHHPDNLFVACQILSRGRGHLLDLARLQPNNEAWNICLTKLREWAWRPELEEHTRTRAGALQALDKFFKGRKSLPRQFNPITARLRRTRRRAEPDLELQQLRANPDGPDPLPSQQASSEDHAALPSIVITMPGGSTDTTESTSLLPSGNLQVVLQPSDSASNAHAQPQDVTSPNQPDPPTSAGEILNGVSLDGSPLHGNVVGGSESSLLTTSN